MLLDRLVTRDPPRDMPEKIGDAVGEVIAIGVWLMMFWVIYQAL